MFSHARFSELMQNNGVSNYKLAQFLECSQSSVKNWLSKTEPSAEYIAKIAEFFSVSVNYLLGIEEPQEKKLADNDELAESFEILRSRPETRSLLHASKGMTAEQVKQMAQFMISMRGGDNGYSD